VELEFDEQDLDIAAIRKLIKDEIFSFHPEARLLPRCTKDDVFSFKQGGGGGGGGGGGELDEEHGGPSAKKRTLSGSEKRGTFE
jgi:hypothetical protein